jgi:hypothetical protein
MPQDNSTPVIRIIKIGNCTTLSGKGQLGYHIGLDEESEILFRMTSNSGGGYFSPEWVSLKSIQNALENGHKPLTSYALSQLFKGKSVNTPSFLFATLLAEGLVQRDEENPRVYVSCPPDPFMAEVDLLVTSAVALKVDARITGKGVVKKGRPPIPKKSPSRGRPRKLRPLP